MNDELNAYIVAHRRQMIETLQKVIAIPSYRSRAEPGAPYGTGPAAVLKALLQIARDLRFPTVVNIDHQCGYCEFGEGDEIVGIFPHFDVVPEGTGWTYPPYAAQIHDGWLYGRGAVDNKGPGIACLYAMKAIMDLHLPVRRRIRMVFGINEESGMEDIQYYVRKLGAPAMGFSPDAQFPVSFAEKAGATVHVEKRLSGTVPDGLALICLSGGDSPCNIADTAYAVLRTQDEQQAGWIEWKLAMFVEKTAWDLRAERDGLQITVYSKGRTGHPYTPRLGQNAISQLIVFLDRLNIAGEAGELIHAFREKIGMEYYGESLGIDREDSSGFLTFSNTHIRCDKDRFFAIFKLYRPYYYAMEDLVSDINRAFAASGIRVTDYRAGVGVMRDSQSPLIQTLSSVYSEMTGKDGTPRAVGGTYAKYVPTICGFGAIFPGTKDMCHVVDEAIEVDSFVFLGQIYGQAMLRLANLGVQAHYV